MRLSVCHYRAYLAFLLVGISATMVPACSIANIRQPAATANAPLLSGESSTASVDPAAYDVLGLTRAKVCLGTTREGYETWDEAGADGLPVGNILYGRPILEQPFPVPFLAGTRLRPLGIAGHQALAKVEGADAFVVSSIVAHVRLFLIFPISSCVDVSGVALRIKPAAQAARGR